jgi:hypothetical protein
MTMISVEAVGLCAHYSRQGDWAFELALSIARRHSLRFNIFHFLEDPYELNRRTADKLPGERRWQAVVEAEKKLRLYYDPKLGDFLEAGFRLCEDPEWTELHRCLTHREFQVLVLARPALETTFGGRLIEEFADGFVCPVVLVGPSSPFDIELNSPARLIADQIGLGGSPSMARVREERRVG